ncbi:hypothetical protein SUBVAR_06410 [Subdoligranulum variabile DSM 15176]|uniref:Uncharacterized protein n=1 Tax=Subdoligranulum variabile DSM 15176 TaxID=411471 RepID=D1PPU3_9FIRM|nr:hypothetical protein SUBVAR_06410 [Subdoligranulum variabile DSM 15176]
MIAVEYITFCIRNDLYAATYKGPIASKIILPLRLQKVKHENHKILWF